MKSPAGKPRARRPVQRRPVQLDLRRTPTWPEEDEASEQPDSHFWRWFAVVLLLHVLVFGVLLFVFHGRAKPPEEFLSLLPPGELVKGTPGPATAPKVAPTTPAPSHPKRAAVQPPPPPVKPTPPKPQPTTPVAPKPPPILTDQAITPAPPVKPVPPKPKPVKVKVDLTLQDAPDADQPAPTPTPAPKPKHHEKKPAKPVDAAANTAAADSDTQGLSREEVAQKLGDKLTAAGVDKTDRTGINGAEHSRQSDYSDFYQSIHDQVMNKWSPPNLVDPTATDPVVQIYVEKDGRVPADQVKLLRSSNNSAFDDSAVAAARGMGYTLQPLPDRCPPVISITFNLRQQ
jgi:TonB family protein